MVALVFYPCMNGLQNVAATAAAQAQEPVGRCLFYLRRYKYGDSIYH